MRVVLLTHAFPRAADDPLGAFLLHLLQSIRDRVQVRVVAPHAAGLADVETMDQIPITRFHYAPDAQETLAYTGVMHEQVARGLGGKILFARFLFAYVRAASRVARQQQAQLIHAHWWLPGGLVGAIVSRLSNIPLVITTHGTDVELLRRVGWTRPLARFAFGQAHIITCGSNYLRLQLIALNVADKSRIRVIPMPVNPLFTNANQKSKIPNQKSFFILTVARLTQQKSIDTLIDALAILRARDIDAHLRMVGDGDQRSNLEQRAGAKNMQAHVEFFGMRPQTELPALYAASDVFVLPSIREGMGLVLAEALLCGVPVVAADSGGVTDIVHANETGLLFPERDASALADALEKYARDPELSARLAENGRKHVRAAYSPQGVAQQFLQAYQDAAHV